MSSDQDSHTDPDLALVLARLLRRDGLALLERPGRLNGLLRDHAPTAIRDIRLLLVARDAGIPARLGVAADPMAPETLAGEADCMAEAFGCDPALALGVVTTWGRALASLRHATGAVPPPPGAGHPAAAAAQGDPHDGDAPSLLVRWGGIAFAIALLLIALVRWIGWI